MEDIPSLVSKAVDDPDAFTALVQHYQSPLRYSVLQMTGWNAQLTDDILQDTFLKMLQHLARFNHKSNLQTWLYRIACNCLNDYYRKQKIATVNEPILESMPSSSSDDMIDYDIHRQVAHLLSTFPLTQRMVLHLHLHREYDQSEIAQILGIPIGTVKSHIFRGKIKLRTKLSHWQL